MRMMIDNETNRWISLYPIMDFNQSFLSYNTIDGASCQPLFPAVVSQMRFEKVISKSMTKLVEQIETIKEDH